MSVLRARAIPDNVGAYIGGGMMSFLHDVLADGLLPPTTAASGPAGRWTP